MDRPIWHQILRINYISVSTIYSISNFPMSISLSILYQTLIPVAWAVGLIQDGNRCRATGGLQAYLHPFFNAGFSRMSS